MDGAGLVLLEDAACTRELPLHDLLIGEHWALPKMNAGRPCAKRQLAHCAQLDLRESARVLTEWMHDNDWVGAKHSVPANAPDESLEQRLGEGEIRDEGTWVGKGIVYLGVWLCRRASSSRAKCHYRRTLSRFAADGDLRDL